MAALPHQLVDLIMAITRYLRSANIHYAPGRFRYSPQWIVLGVNNVCNLHCKMCDVGTGNTETNFAQNLTGTHPLHMPVELFKRIADQVSEHYPTAKLGYAFTEPLVYKHLYESLAYANKKGLFTSITTNALNLKRKADELLEGGLNELFISLDGLEETHNEIRGNKRSFEKALEGIAYLKDKPGAPDISIFCVITEWNTGELKAFTDFFRDKGVKHVGFMHANFVTPELAARHNEQYGHIYQATPSNVDEVDFSQYDLAGLLEEIRSIKSDNYPFKISFTPEIDTLESLNTYYHKPEQKMGKLCEDLFANLMIKSDGSVIPAHGRCYNVSMGNIYEQNIREIWTGEGFNDIRRAAMKSGGLFPACSRCCSAF